MLEHIILEVFGHLAEVFAHFLDLWRRLHRLARLDLELRLGRALDIANILDDPQLLLLLYPLQSLGRLGLRLLLGSRSPIFVVLQTDNVLDLLFSLVQRARVEEGKDFAHFDKLVELDLELLEQGDLVTHVFLLDRCSGDKLVDGLIDAFDFLSGRAERGQMQVEDGLDLILGLARGRHLTQES